MSQAKVDRYKEEKKNRAKIMKREKREMMATKAGLSLLAIALVAWMGVSVYNGVNKTDDTAAEHPTYTVNTSALDDFMADMEEN